MKFEVPKRHILRPYIIRWHGPTCFAMGKAKRGALVDQTKTKQKKNKGPWQRNDIIDFHCFNEMFCEKKIIWRQVKTREWSNFIFLKTALFGHILKKTKTFTLGAWSFLSIHILFTPCERPKGFVNCFFKKLDHECWTITLNHERWHFFMVHGVNRPLQRIKCGYLIVISANQGKGREGGGYFLRPLLPAPHSLSKPCIYVIVHAYMYIVLSWNLLHRSFSLLE